MYKVATVLKIALGSHGPETCIRLSRSKTLYEVVTVLRTV